MTPKVFERTYAELKREVTSGKYLPGQRLQARGLADVLRTSTSPVTNAMRQLIGEDVLEYDKQDGVIIPRVTERRLRDLYSWNAWLNTAGMDNADAEVLQPELPVDLDHAYTPRAIEVFFLVLAKGVQNNEFTRALENANDRLRSTRHLEGRLFLDIANETSTLIGLWNERNVAGLRKALARYHRRRLDAVAQLVGLSYQDRP